MPSICTLTQYFYFGIFSAAPWSKMGEMAIKNKQIPLSLLNCVKLNRCIVMREILSKGSLEAFENTI